MPKLIRRLNCVETPSGFLLTWDIAEGANILRTTVYGLNGSSQFVLEQPFIPTRRCLIAPKNYNLITAFKISVVDAYGNVDNSDPIAPQRLKKAERLLLQDIRRRSQVYMRATPIGSYPSKILFRRFDGPACELCGSGVCAATGTGAASEYCPMCLGTGIQDPFILYPKTELLHGSSPHDDNPVSQPDVQRSHVVRQFVSVFDLMLNVDDVFVSGTEVYKILEQQVQNSVGGIPATYVIKAIKLPPEDPKYETLIALAAGDKK